MLVIIYLSKPISDKIVAYLEHRKGKITKQEKSQRKL